MREREPLAANLDFGKDEDQTEVMLKKHTQLESEFSSFKGTFKALTSQGEEVLRTAESLTAAPGDGLEPGKPTKRKVKAMYKYAGTKDREVGVNTLLPVRGPGWSRRVSDMVPPSA